MDIHGRFNQLLSYFGGAAVIIATLAAALPSIAALVAVIWYLIQVYESKTVQRWIARRHLRRLARMKAAVLMLETKSAPWPPEMLDDPKRDNS